VWGTHEFRVARGAKGPQPPRLGQTAEWFRPSRVVWCSLKA